MTIIGPAWPSTKRLQERLKSLKGEPLHYGGGGCDGLEQLKRFREAGILCPTFTTNIEEAKSWVRAGEVVWGRKRHHTQGLDIVGAGYRRWGRGREVWNPKWLRREFWVKVIPNIINEYRQHVFNEFAIRRGKKVQTGDPTRQLLVRSRKNNWHLDYGPFEAPKGLREIAKTAVKSLNYLMGAVDIIETLDHKLYVLEVNSAPSLRDDNTLEAYAQAIERYTLGKKDKK